MTEREIYVRNWIEKVSVIREELKGFSICPFASRSLYKIVECKISDIQPETGYDLVIFIVEDHLSECEIQDYIEKYNKLYSEWEFLEDCAFRNTYIGEVQTNNGKYNLILVQPLEKLREYRKKLAKTEYYSLWSDEYLRKILQDDYEIVKKPVEMEFS